MNSEPQKPKWRENIWFVLFTVFVVTGILGLPLVWKNPRFSKNQKIAITIALIALTIFFIDTFISIFRKVTAWLLPLL